MSDKQSDHKRCPVCNARMVKDFAEYGITSGRSHSIQFHWWCGEHGYQGEWEWQTHHDDPPVDRLRREWERLQAQEKETP